MTIERLWFDEALSNLSFEILMPQQRWAEGSLARVVIASLSCDQTIRRNNQHIQNSQLNSPAGFPIG
jgi:hypothetical protein